MDHYNRSMLNTFTSCPVDRMSHMRQDEGWLAALLEDRTTRFVPVWGMENLFAGEQDLKPVLLAPQEMQAYVHAAESTVLLGVQEGQAYFAIGLSAEQGPPPAGLAGLGQFRDLRQVAPLLNRQDGALLAYARAMTYWHHRHRFCGDCGSPTTGAEGGFERICTSERCGQHHFPRMDPAIIVLVTLGDRCLLGRKPVWPEGQYSTIAGFVEPGECLEDAVIREVGEETGVQVGEMSYHSSQPWPFPSSLMLGFTAHAVDESIRVDQDELEHARWFTRQEIQRGLEQGTLRLPPRISVSYRLIEDWFDAGSLGPLQDAIPA